MNSNFIPKIVSLFFPDISSEECSEIISLLLEELSDSASSNPISKEDILNIIIQISREIGFKKQLLNRNKLEREELITNKDIGIPNSEFRNKLHPYLHSILKAKRSLSLQKIDVIDKYGILDLVQDKSKGPFIFANTHIGKWDIEIFFEAIKVHNYLLTADEGISIGSFEHFFSNLNGDIYFDEKDNDDVKRVLPLAKKYLSEGKNLQWYIEGIWNLSPNQIILPCPFGIIEAAYTTNATIIPVALDQDSKHFTINIGDIFDYHKYLIPYNKDTKVEAINSLRDSLATLKWEIWEKNSVCKRSEIPDDYFDKFIENRIKEWPKFTLQEIKSREFKLPGVSKPDEVFAYVKRT